MKILINNQGVLHLNKQSHMLLNSGNSEFSKALVAEYNAQVVEIPNIQYECTLELTLEDFDLIDNKYVFNKQQEEIATLCEIMSLRIQRDKECFTIINRGQLWYNSLTQSQVEELQSWYELWLNVTESLTPPHKPEWL